MTLYVQLFGSKLFRYPQFIYSPKSQTKNDQYSQLSGNPHFICCSSCLILDLANFVLLPTNFFIFDSAGIIHTDQLLWSNVTYRKLLLTFLLLLINQKWFYFFFFFYLVTWNNPMLFLYVMLHALILYLPFFTCLVLLISIIPSQRCNTVTSSVTS